MATASPTGGEDDDAEDEEELGCAGGEGGNSERWATPTRQAGGTSDEGARHHEATATGDEQARQGW